MESTPQDRLKSEVSVGRHDWPDRRDSWVAQGLPRAQRVEPPAGHRVLRRSRLGS